LIISIEHIGGITKNRYSPGIAQLFLWETSAEKRNRRQIYFFGRLDIIGRIADRNRLIGR